MVISCQVAFLFVFLRFLIKKKSYRVLYIPNHFFNFPFSIFSVESLNLAHGRAMLPRRDGPLDSTVNFLGPCLNGVSQENLFQGYHMPFFEQCSSFYNCPFIT